MPPQITIRRKKGIFAERVTVEIDVTEGEGDDLPLRPMRLRELTNVGQNHWDAIYDFPMGSGHSVPKRVTVVGDHIEFKLED